MDIPKNLIHFFHLTPNGSLSQFWRDPIHIASVFVTLSLSPEVFSNNSSNANKARAESRSHRAAVVSSANSNNLVSKPSIDIPLMFSSFLIAIA